MNIPELLARLYYPGSSQSRLVRDLFSAPRTPVTGQEIINRVGRLNEKIKEMQETVSALHDLLSGSFDKSLQPPIALGSYGEDGKLEVFTVDGNDLEGLIYWCRSRQWYPYVVPLYDQESVGTWLTVDESSITWGVDRNQKFQRFERTADYGVARRSCSLGYPMPLVLGVTDGVQGSEYPHDGGHPEFLKQFWRPVDTQKS